MSNSYNTSIEIVEAICGFVSSRKAFKRMWEDREGANRKAILKEAFRDTDCLFLNWGCELIYRQEK